MTQEDFDAAYRAKTTVTYNAFSSTAKAMGPAQNFANGGGQVRLQPNQTVSVLLILDVTNGRDIEPLSLLGAMEKEILLLPGAHFAIEKVERHDKGDKGNPEATAWFTVRLTQIR
jgi:hypothetical protein